VSGIIATPPAVVINARNGRLHIETCATVRAHPEDVDPIFTNWGSKDIATAVAGRDLHPCRSCKPIGRLATWEHHHRPAGELSVLVEAVESHRFPLLDEDHLQGALAAVLVGRREVQLSLGGRVDVLVGRIGVEAKVAGSAEDVFRQVLRYSHSPELAGLLIVTTKESHTRVPPMAGGKPVRVAIARGGI